ncbi:expressed protein [Phakopsora pachyrhizi]|uniref:Expressed protein n=1 Tax=Phakopsora pachyrhizi TaxID=170000 RepID=A0AAV0BD37_PHAPC|nr:expressed protein [Phakopsora pachyrhizi]
MGDAGFFKGTSSEQDTRFKDKEKSLLKSINFPKELDKKVDMRKVELSVMRPWIAQKIMELLGFEDEVVVEYVNGLLEDPATPIVDPKRMQINLTGFLESKTGPFMSELWALLISAQDSPLKVPALFIEQKKEEMRKRELEDIQAKALNQKRLELEQENERRLADIRRRERDEANSTNSNRDQLINQSNQRGLARSTGGSTTVTHFHRSNFVPPRDRDTGWGSRGGGRQLESAPRERDPAPSNYRRGRSRSPINSRRDTNSHKAHLPAYRRRRSTSRSRSRSFSPPSRRTRWRSPSASPRFYRRSPEHSRMRRRGSPLREHRVYRPSPSRSASRSLPSDSPHRMRSRWRSPTRSLSPPRQRVSDIRLAKDSISRNHNRKREACDHRSKHDPSQSTSPPKKRIKDGSDDIGQGSSRQGLLHKGSPCRSSSPHHPHVEAHHENLHSKSGRSSHISERSPQSNSSSRSFSPALLANHKKSNSKCVKSRRNKGRSSDSIHSTSLSSPTALQQPVEEHEDVEFKKRPAVISIKGCASKPHDRHLGHGCTESKDEGARTQTSVPVGGSKSVGKETSPVRLEKRRSLALTQVVKERLLREKLKTGML